MYGGPLQLQFLLKKSNIWPSKSFESNSLYLKKWQCREHVFLFQLTLTINITPINITLCILEKKRLRVPKSYKVMLKLILIFRSVLCPQVFLVQRTHFLSVKTTIYLFFNYYPVENRLEQRCFFKKQLFMSHMVFLYKSGPIGNP